MDMTNNDYGKLVNERSRPSPMWKNMIWAFFVGGIICTIGQGLGNLYQTWGLDKEMAGSAASVSLILLSALLTGMSLYEKNSKTGRCWHIGSYYRICKCDGFSRFRV